MNSSSRNGAAVRCLALHTSEGAATVGQLRAFFDASGKASSHASADSTGALADGAAGGFVDYANKAWTIRNGNAWTDNIELCGYASWSRVQWLAVPKLLEACATWLARRSRARGIPLVHLTVDQLRQGRSGVIDHDDYSDATGDGTHWDVGENFPWDVVIPRAIALAGGSPPPAPARHRKRRSMYIVRNTETGGMFLATDRGMIHLETVEEVNVAGWLLDDTRPANATLSHNGRFAAVCQAVLTRSPYTQTMRKAGGVHRAGLTDGALLAEAPAPEPVIGDDIIQPPPGMDVFLPDEPDHA